MTTFSINNQFNDLVKVTLSEQQTESNNNNIQQEVMVKSAKRPDFFQGNKSSERKYTTTRIKSRNFLSNISYVGIKKEDFIFDIYLLITKNLNQFSTEILPVYLQGEEFYLFE